MVEMRPCIDCGKHTETIFCLRCYMLMAEKAAEEPMDPEYIGVIEKYMDRIALFPRKGGSIDPEKTRAYLARLKAAAGGELPSIY